MSLERIATGLKILYVFSMADWMNSVFNRALSSDEIEASYDAGIYRLYNNFTNLPEGVYTYRAYAQDLSGNVNQTEMRSLTIGSSPVSGGPAIIGYAPSSPVSDFTGATRSFNMIVTRPLM